MISIGNNNYDRMKRLFDTLHNLGFWKRLFGWQKIRNLILDANAELSIVQSNLERLTEEKEHLKSSLTELSGKLQFSESMLSDRQNRINELNSDIRLLNEKNDRFSSEHEEDLALITQYETLEESRRIEHFKHTATLKGIQDNIQTKQKDEEEKKHQAEIDRIARQASTWSDHEELVKQHIKNLCSKHTIQYIDKVPFKGEPDNTLEIAGEFIIFDAKSPRGDDLTHFPSYIKEQTEKAKKYAREENVKKWIFFVVPSNTLETLHTFVYPLADYEVFIITLDALEPVILSLRKIEDYDFADQMNPEDRENICRVLGKFAHLSKRRIQIDTYFINQFMELAYKAESELPPDILEKVMEFEKAEKLNPPQEKRAKAIPLTELQKVTEKLKSDALHKGIMVEEEKISDGLNKLPLYKTME